MIGLDTNVLVRYLVQDDASQFKLAVQLIEQESELFINSVVLCELVWILESCYDMPKPVLINVLEKVLSTKTFVIEKSALAWKALQEFRTNGSDFSDSLIGQINLSEQCEFTASFDKSLKKLNEFRILSS